MGHRGAGGRWQAEVSKDDLCGGLIEAAATRIAAPGRGHGWDTQRDEWLPLAGGAGRCDR